MNRTVNLAFLLSVTFLILTFNCDNSNKPKQTKKAQVTLNEKVIKEFDDFQFPAPTGGCLSVTPSSVDISSSGQPEGKALLTWTPPVGGLVNSYTVKLTINDLFIGNFRTEEPKLTVVNAERGQSCNVILQSNCSGSTFSETIVIDRIVVK